MSNGSATGTSQAGLRAMAWLRRALAIAPGMLLRRAGSERYAGEPKHAPVAASGRHGADEQLESCACPGVYLDGLTDLTPLEREWRSFEAEADCTAFQCFGWAAKW